MYKHTNTGPLWPGGCERQLFGESCSVTGWRRHVNYLGVFARCCLFLFLLFCLFMSWLIMKQCAGDSSESRKCLNLSSSSRIYTAAGGRLLGWRGAHNSTHCEAFNRALRKTEGSARGKNHLRHSCWGQINFIFVIMDFQEDTDYGLETLCSILCLEPRSTQRSTSVMTIFQQTKMSFSCRAPAFCERQICLCPSGCVGLEITCGGAYSCDIAISRRE